MVELEPHHQLRPRIGLVRARPDEPNRLVERIEDLRKGLQDVNPPKELRQVELEPTLGDLVSEGLELNQHLAQVHSARRQRVALPGRHQHRHVHREPGLKLRLLVDEGHHRLRRCVPLELEHHPNLFGRLVTHVRQLRQPAGPHMVGNLRHQVRLVHRVGNRGDDDQLAPRLLLNPVFAPVIDRPRPVLVDLDDLRTAVQDLAPRGEVGPLHKAGYQLLGCQIGLIDQGNQGIHDLPQVMGRNVGRHADSNARHAVQEQVGQLRRQHHRLVALSIVGGPHRHRILRQLRQHLHGDVLQPHLGVPHRGGRIAIHRAEVPLTVDHRIPQREGLRHARERLVDRQVTVRVMLTHHLANDRGTLLVLGLGQHAEVLEHRVKDAPLHRLESVAHIGQRARGDDRKRVVQVTGAGGLCEDHILNIVSHAIRRVSRGPRNILNISSALKRKVSPSG